MRRLAIINELREQLTHVKPLKLKPIFLSFTAVFTLFFAIASYIHHEKIIADFHLYIAKQGFTPKRVKIIGRHHIDKQILSQILDTYHGQSIFHLDLHDLRKTLLDLGWTKEVIVSRTLPDRLDIHLIERIPVALVQTAQGHKLIDETGAIINGANAADFSHLIVASGKGATVDIQRILDTLKTEPEIYADVWAVQMISERRWDIYLRSGMIIKLPEHDPGMAWSRLARLEQETNIMRRDLASIDLRIPDQLIVEPNIAVRGKGRKT